MASRLINRIQGKVYGWFDSKSPREMTAAAPVKFQPRARLALQNLEDRTNPVAVVVNTTAFTGPGSISDAITQTNADIVGPNSITFDATVFSTPQTITFTGGARLVITEPVTITGTQTAGANNVTLSGGGTQSLFQTAAVTGAAITFDKLVFTKAQTTSVTGTDPADTTSGSVIIIDDEVVTVSNSTITANTGFIGGAFRVTNTAAGTLNLTNSVITNNSCTNTTNASGGGVARTTNNTKVNVTNCIISNNSSSGGGGAFVGIGSSYSITNSTITNNSATNRGGFLFSAGATAGVPATITNSILSGNTSGVLGGALYFSNNNQDVLISNSTLTANSSLFGGGFHTFGFLSLTVAECNITGNFSGSYGAAASFKMYASAPTATFRNTTISGNSTAADGGAIQIIRSYATNTFNVNNCTITGNTSSSTSTVQGQGAGGIGVGGVGVAANIDVTLNINSTILSGNTQNGAGGGGFNDLGVITGVGTQLINVANSAIGSNVGHTPVLTLPTPGATNLAYGTDLKLGTFTDNGGALQGSSQVGGGLASAKTFALLPGSPAINAGSNPDSLTTDQRGAGFPRVQQAAADIGAFEFLPSTVPTFNKQSYTTVTTDNKNNTGINPYVFTVTYVAATGETLVPGSVGINDVSVTGTINGSPVTLNPTNATYNSTDGNLTGKVTYTIDPNPNGGTSGWDFLDSGVYTVKVNANTNVQSSGGGFAVAGDVGTFNVAVGKTFIVDTFIADEKTDTDGKLSLREAIIAANSAGPGGQARDFIEFDPTVFASDQTITLSLANGTLPVSTPMLITGPTSSRVSVSAGKTGLRVFTISDDVAGTSTLSNSATISNLTITGASGTGAGGVLIGNADVLTLNNSTVSNNTGTNQNGAGIFVSTNGTLALNDSVVSGNSASGTGGGIQASTGANFTATNSTLASNTAASYLGGGGFFMSGHPSKLQFINATISSNNAYQGGGISLFNFANAANVAGSNKLQLINSTVTNNTASLGGGIVRINGQGGIVLTSTIVSGNAAGTGPDFSITGGAAANSITATNSSVGVDPGLAWATSNSTGNNLAFGANLFLTPLQSNGGAVPTHAIGQGSAAIDAGSNTLTLTTDARGTGFPRVVGTAADIGAAEGAVTPPSAQGTFTNVTSGSATNYTFTVVYNSTNPATMDVSSIGNGDIQVTGPNSYIQLATLVSTTGSGGTITATYSVPAPGGAFDIGDDGVYRVAMLANEVKDSNTLAVAAGTLGNFQVFYAASFVVDTNIEPTSAATLDDGDGLLSLREAINRANLITGTGGFGPFPGADKITFNTTAGGAKTDFSTPTSITLSLGAITIADSVSIVGPNPTDATQLNISGGGTDRHFLVNLATNAINFSNLTLSGGTTTGNGGSINLLAHDAVFNNVVFDNNRATGIGGVISTTIGNNITITNSKITNSSTGLVNGFGGAISATSTIDTAKITIINSELSNNLAAGNGAVVATGVRGDVTITNCIVTNNNAGGATASGGAFFVGSNATLTITGSTITNNSSTTQGGAIFGRVANAQGSPSVSIVNSTLSGNSTGGNGGAIYFASGGSLNITGSTLSGNTASGTNGGGAIYFYGTVGSNGFNIRNSTISGNFANNATPNAGYGGGIMSLQTTGTFSIVNTTITGNVANSAGGGGIYIQGAGGKTATVNITSSIVSGNTAAGVADDFYLLATQGTATAIFSAIGKDAAGATGLNYTSPTNLSFGTPLLLDVLANNGGPTQTHALLTGSPAENKGSNPLGLTTDQRGATFARTSGGGTDIGAFEVQSTTPTVSSFTVNNGATQRSRIVSIELTFSGAVTPATFPNLGDILLTRTGLASIAQSGQTVGGAGGTVQSGPAASNHITITQNGANGLTLTFDNNGSFTTTSTGVENGSLSDGYWQLFVGGTAVSTPGALTLRRLYGDSTSSASGTIDGADLTDFGNNFNAISLAYDFDNNGVVDGADLTTFGNRFGNVL